MPSLIKILFGLLVSLSISTCYAINIKVESNTKDIDGLGFTVNGKSHGGPGNVYQATDMPAGVYMFGIRSNDKDIFCMSAKGSKKVKLTRDTIAMLDFNGKHCALKIR